MVAPELEPNLIALFERAAARAAANPFLWTKINGVYRSSSWDLVARQARLIARSLQAHGIEPGERVMLVGENRPEWLAADLAIMTAGAVSVPAYTTNSVDDHLYLLTHSEASAAIVSTNKLAANLLPALAQVSGIKVLLSFEALTDGAGLPFPVIAWDQALALGEQAAELRFDAAATLTAADTACFIYTSGTGGKPKGVMLSHGNVLANVSGAHEVLATIGLGNDVFLSFLPLSHAYEHTAGQFLPISVGAEIYYAEGLETLSTNMLEARPTIMACVPRLYEVMRQRILKGIGRQSGLKPWLFNQAVAVGRRAYERSNNLNPLDLALNPVLEKLVRAKVRDRFGGRIKALVSGGAPLNYDVGLFFTALGLPVFQGYGLTECAPVISVNMPGRCKLHTVGPPLPGIDVKIAADGEILVRGGSVMQGYWRDQASTEAALQNGWLHTGDVGLIDDDGFLQITDRKKDLIVNSGGDNIAPQRVEGILALEPEIGQVIVYGDQRPNLVALIVPDADAVRSYGREHGLGADFATIAANPGFQKVVGAAVDRANKNLSTIERIRRFRVLEEPFTIEQGTMTPTQKLKRPIIYRTYQDTLEGLYQARK